MSVIGPFVGVRGLCFLCSDQETIASLCTHVHAHTNVCVCHAYWDVLRGQNRATNALNC